MMLIYSDNISELMSRSLKSFECCTFPNLIRHKIVLMRPTPAKPYVFQYDSEIYYDDDETVIGTVRVIIQVKPVTDTPPFDSYAITDVGIALGKEKKHAPAGHPLRYQAESGHSSRCDTMWA